MNTRKRPLPRRFLKPIYVSNETEYGSGEYEEPILLYGLVSDKPQNLIGDSGVKITQYNSIVRFEYNEANAKKITDTSHFWIRRVPREEQDKADFTHTVRGTLITEDDQYIKVELRGVAGNTPIF